MEEIFKKTTICFTDESEYEKFKENCLQKSKDFYGQFNLIEMDLEKYYKYAKEFCEMYERSFDVKIKKLLYEKMYIDFGLGCYYKAYIHSYKEDKYGNWYVFVKSKNQIDLSLNEINDYICCKTDLEGVYKNKQEFMTQCCN